MQIRWTPFNDLTRLQADLDRFFGGTSSERAWNPHFDVTEDASRIVLEADLPGVRQEQLELQVEQNVLTIKGERKPVRAADEKGDQYRHYERIQGAFTRSFKVPATVDAEKITAQLRDGVLTVVLPKRPEAQPQKIKVSVSS
jgi:HSP20 family protein